MSIVGEIKGLSISIACLTVNGEEHKKEEKYSGRKICIFVNLCSCPLGPYSIYIFKFGLNLIFSGAKPEL